MDVDLLDWQLPVATEEAYRIWLQGRPRGSVALLAHGTDNSDQGKPEDPVDGRNRQRPLERNGQSRHFRVVIAPSLGWTAIEFRHGERGVVQQTQSAAMDRARSLTGGDEDVHARNLKARLHLAHGDVLDPAWMLASTVASVVGQGREMGRDVLRVEALPLPDAPSIPPGWEGADTYYASIDSKTGVGLSLDALHCGRLFRFKRTTRVVIEAP